MDRQTVTRRDRVVIAFQVWIDGDEHQRAHEFASPPEFARLCPSLDRGAFGRVQLAAVSRRFLGVHRYATWGPVYAFQHGFSTLLGQLQRSDVYILTVQCRVVEATGAFFLRPFAIAVMLSPQDAELWVTGTLRPGCGTKAEP